MNTMLKQTSYTANPFGAGRARPGCRAMQRRAPVQTRAVLDDSAGLLAVVPLLAAGGVSAWKFAMYGQMEVITVSMLTNNVPRGSPGPRVIQLQGGTKELYYYPKSTVQVTVVGEEVNKAYIDQAAVQAAIPAVAKQQSPANLGFAADASVEAVVSLGALAGMSEVQRNACVAEALRVLKPGCPLIFIERLPGGVPLRYLGAPSTAISESVFRGWEQRPDGAFSLVRWDTALGGQDPHAVGVAVKAADYRGPSRRAEKAAEKAAEREADKEAKREKARLPKKGFE